VWLPQVSSPLSLCEQSSNGVGGGEADWRRRLLRLPELEPCSQGEGHDATHQRWNQQKAQGKPRLFSVHSAV